MRYNNNNLAVACRLRLTGALMVAAADAALAPLGPTEDNDDKDADKIHNMYEK